MLTDKRLLSIITTSFILGCYLQILAQPTTVNPAAMSLLARQDSSVAAQTLVVRTIKTNFQNNLQGVTVTLYRLPNHEQITAFATDSSGRAEFSNLTPGKYVVEATFQQEPLVSTPIEITKDDQAGYRMLLVFQPMNDEKEKRQVITKQADPSQSHHVFIDPSSYILVLFQSDDVLEVHEAIFLHNPLSVAIDLGPEGIKIPIAEHAQGIEVFSHAKDSHLSIEQPDPNQPAHLVWKNSIPPGTHLFEISFVLTGKHNFQFQQTITLPWQSPAILLEHQDLAVLEGEGFSNPFPINTPQFKQLTAYVHSTDVKPGSSLSFHVVLNSPFPTIPIVFGLLSGLTLFVCWLVSYRKQQLRQARDLATLFQKRDQLLAKLSAIPSTEIEPDQQEVLELMQIYKQIEQV